MTKRVSIHGMYDCHLFKEYTGHTVDELLMNWLEDISTPTPAAFSDGTFVDDLGPTSLGPAIVLDGKKELRRVGNMVFVRVLDYGKETQRVSPEIAQLIEYRRALLEDPDIPSLLDGSYSTPAKRLRRARRKADV